MLFCYPYRHVSVWIPWQAFTKIAKPINTHEKELQVAFYHSNTNFYEWHTMMVVFTYSSAFSVFLVFLESTFSQQNLSLHHQCSANDVLLMYLNSHSIQVQISSVTLKVIDTATHLYRTSHMWVILIVSLHTRTGTYNLSMHTCLYACLDRQQQSTLASNI